MPHFNTPHAFKKIGETQPGEMHHTRFLHEEINLILMSTSILLEDYKKKKKNTLKLKKIKFIIKILKEK